MGADIEKGKNDPELLELLLREAVAPLREVDVCVREMKDESAVIKLSYKGFEEICEVEF